MQDLNAVFNLLPVIMFTAAFLGGFYMVVDMTAGEKERESLEPLLINAERKPPRRIGLNQSKN